jgi:hypothetical protein
MINGINNEKKSNCIYFYSNIYLKEWTKRNGQFFNAAGIGVGYEIKSVERIIPRGESRSALTRYGSAISTLFHASRSGRHGRLGPSGGLLPRKDIHFAPFAAVTAPIAVLLPSFSISDPIIRYRAAVGA